MKEEGLCPKCQAGKLLVISEKIYEATLRDNSLILEADNETWLEIKCSECEHIFDPDEFDEIY